MEMNEKTSDHVLDEDTQDGHLEINSNNTAESNIKTVNKNLACSGCEQNGKLISELWLKTTALENKFQSFVNSNERVENECLPCDQSVES